MPAWLTVGGGLLLIASGTLCQAVLDAGSDWTALVPGFVLVGVGTGFVAPTVAGAALAAVPAERSGMAGGAVNTVRQLGYALGVAVFGTVLTSRMTGRLPDGAAHTLAGGGAGALRGAFPEHTLRAAFASGLNGALVVAGLAGMVAGALVLVLVRAGRPTAPEASGAVPEEAVPARG